MKKNKKYFGKDEVNKKQKNKRNFKREDFLENELLLDNDLHPFSTNATDATESTDDFSKPQEYENEIFSAEYIYKLVKKSNRPLRLDDILRYSKLTRRSKKEVLFLLKQLISEGKIIRLSGASYIANEEAKLVVGKVIVQRSGSAFVSPLKTKSQGDRSEDIFIPNNALKDAWNGDIVEVKILPKTRMKFDRPDLKREGMIERVIERGQEEFIVRLEQVAEKIFLKHVKPTKSAFLARPIDNRYNFNILIPNTPIEPQTENSDFNVGDLVVVHIEKQLPSGSNTLLWLAKPVRKFGEQNKVSVQEEMAKLSNGVPTNFPDDVLEEAKQIATAEGFYYTDLDGAGLKNEVKLKLAPHDVDLRQIDFVTIDGADSKDFDDAIYVERSKDGWLLMVAIADVSHYVQPFSKLDKEARIRGNSYYFPNSVEPMLPEFLSNGLCSLRPHEDHRTMFAKMHFSQNGIIQNSSFGQGIISSKARLTYEAVQEFFEQGKAVDAPLAENLTPDVMKMLTEAKELAKVLIARRQKDGYLHLEIPEPKALVQDDQVVGYGSRAHFFAHELIEAFMVAANEAVAEFLTAKNAPCLYRAHPEPTAEKLERLKNVLQNTAISHILPKKNVEKQGPSAWLRHILTSLKDLKQADKEVDDLQNPQTKSSNILEFSPKPKVDNTYMVHRLVLRSMMQARYTPILEKHFGLASGCYCHFTSPIRRYSDLMVHRSLKAQLGITKKSKEVFSEQVLLQVADICNECERKAFGAEREVFKRLSCLYLADKVGLEYDATISGVTNFGIFAELVDFPAEGMIRMDHLGEDYFIFDESTQCLYGQKSGVKYRLGDYLKIKIQDININNLEINLGIVGIKKRKKDSEKKSKLHKKSTKPMPKRKYESEQNTKNKSECIKNKPKQNVKNKKKINKSKKKY